MNPGRDAIGRRRFLTGTVGTLAAVAGCVDGDGGSSGDGESSSDGGSSSDGESSSDGGGDPDGEGRDGTDDPDLREANVVDVAVSDQGGTYTFDVSLHHDDGGEDGYANWWQVERLNGTMLGRRDLRHAHSRQPFTRSETIEVPGDVDCVVVRGHDQTHGYGGLAAILRLDSGSYRTVEQGSEQQSFDTGDCP